VFDSSNSAVKIELVWSIRNYIRYFGKLCLASLTLSNQKLKRTLFGSIKPTLQPEYAKEVSFYSSTLSRGAIIL